MINLCPPSPAPLRSTALATKNMRSKPVCAFRHNCQVTPVRRQMSPQMRRLYCSVEERAVNVYHVVHPKPPNMYSDNPSLSKHGLVSPSTGMLWRLKRFLCNVVEF